MDPARMADGHMSPPMGGGSMSGITSGSPGHTYTCEGDVVGSAPHTSPATQSRCRGCSQLNSSTFPTAVVGPRNPQEQQLVSVASVFDSKEGGA